MLEINNARLVEDVAIRFDALPDVVLPGRIKEIGREASQATRTFPVTLIFDADQAGVDVQPGMAGEAKAQGDLPREETGAGVEVPTSAIFTPDGADAAGSFVWIVDETASAVTRRRVENLRITQQGTTHVRGIEPGERVVTKGVHRLREGQEVLVR